MKKLNKMVFLEAAVEMGYDAGRGYDAENGCCDVVYDASVEHLDGCDHNVFDDPPEGTDEHTALLEGLFRPRNKPQVYWWDSPGTKDSDVYARMNALLLLHEVCRESWVPELVTKTIKKGR